jgi:hypothetical protein
MRVEDRRFWFGMTVSVGWLAFAAYMLCKGPLPEELNAWGDFFAGFFAPLAFLWLVIGYLQQGEELKHSTEALRLQAAELRNSVEQQSQLVAVSREQMKQEYEVLQEERELRRDAARPKFVPQLSGTTSSAGNVTYKVKLVNVGNTATKFRMSFEPPLEQPQNHNLAFVARDDVVALELRFALPAPSVATIKYIDADGLPGEVRFTLQAPGGSKLILGDIERVI